MMQDNHIMVAAILDSSGVNVRLNLKFIAIGVIPALGEAASHVHLERHYQKIPSSSKINLL